jgi:hypothetical protein
LLALNAINHQNIPSLKRELKMSSSLFSVKISVNHAKTLGYKIDTDLVFSGSTLNVSCPKNAIRAIIAKILPAIALYALQVAIKDEGHSVINKSQPRQVTQSYVVSEDRVAQALCEYLVASHLKMQAANRNDWLANR